MWRAGARPAAFALVGGAVAALVAATLSARPSAPVTAVAGDQRPGSVGVRSQVGGGQEPVGDAVALPTGWRTLRGPVVPDEVRRPDADLLARLGVTVVDAVVADVDADGSDEVVVVFLRPARHTLVGDALATPAPVDDLGRTLHLGVFSADDLRQEWVAGTVMRPVSAVAACGGTLLLGYTSAIGSDDRTAVGVVTWRGYGFVGSPALPDLPGAGAPACADIDADGVPDPIVLGRSAP